MKTVMILYVPVLHNGYLRLFRDYRNGVETLYILGRDLIREFTFLEEEIRAVDPGIMAEVIRSLGFFQQVEILDKIKLSDISSIRSDCEIIAADEGISRRLAAKYFSNHAVRFLPVFLRWDEQNIFSKHDVKCDRVSEEPFDRGMMAAAVKEGGKTSDWWRQGGAVVVRDGNILLQAHNNHLPSEHTPYVLGDPRDFIKAGEASEISSALHAEQAVIVEAARRGQSLEGTSLYVSVFPCPVCAKLVAKAGFKQCFFGSGHASLDGEAVLKSAGVGIILVK